MFILDCSTRNQALLSLSAGFGCTVPELSAVLLSLDLDHIFETDHSIKMDGCQYLREYVCAKLGKPHSFTSAYGFHGTRTFAGNPFSEGLLALNKSEARVMQILIDQAPDAVVREKLQEWDVQGCVPDSMFQLRTGSKMHWGPYGHLIREVHFHASDLGLHDYIQLPELIEDVCNAYQEEYGHDLTGHYRSVLPPCIVWFLSDIEDDRGPLESALRYAYTSVRGLPPDSGTTFGIDRNGEPVPRDAIVKVEFLQPGLVQNEKKTGQ